MNRLFKGQKGNYLDCTIFVDLAELDQYGNSGMITQDVSKEEKDAGVKGNILGNGKVFWVEGGQAPQQAGQAPQQGFQQALSREFVELHQADRKPPQAPQQFAPQQMQQAPTLAQQQVAQHPQAQPFDDVPF